MNLQKWLLIAGLVLLLGAAGLVAFSYAAPYALAQGPMGGWWNGSGDNGFGPGFGMMGRGMMYQDGFGPGFGMGPGGMMGWGGPENSVLSIVADKLGMTTDELLAELQAGKTIATIAGEKNVAVDIIVEAIVTPRSEQLTQRVTDGQLTQERADAMLVLMKIEIKEHLNEAWSPGGFGGPRGMMGPGMMGSGMMGGGHHGGMMGGGMMGGGHHGGMMGGGMMGPGMMGGRWGGAENSPVTIITEKLGLTRQELATELQAGKSIAEIAKEKDVALDTIVDAVLAPRAERLKALVTSGQLTQEEVDSRLANLKVDMIDWLNQGWGAPQDTAPNAAPDGSGSF